VVLKSTYTDRYPLDPAAVVVPEIRLVGCRCGPFAAALRLLQHGWVAPRPLIAGIFPLARGLSAIACAQRRGSLKVLLDCSGND
jgi:threonine dehydrogenase-like Zn-dependent dehydrogenase